MNLSSARLSDCENTRRHFQPFRNAARRWGRSGTRGHTQELTWVLVGDGVPQYFTDYHLFSFLFFLSVTLVFLTSQCRWLNWDRIR